MSERYYSAGTPGLINRKMEISGGRLSRTIPDQSLSIRDILRRYSQGLGFSNLKVGTYDEDAPDLPDFKKMDLSEIHDFKMYVADQLKDARDRLTKNMEKRRADQTLDMYKKWKAEEDSKKADVDSPS